MDVVGLGAPSRERGAQDRRLMHSIRDVPQLRSCGFVRGHIGGCETDSEERETCGARAEEVRCRLGWRLGCATVATLGE